MSENTKPNNERPADLAVQDSVGGMARRLFEPRPPAGPRGAQRQDPAGAGAEQLWRDVKFRVGWRCTTTTGGTAPTFRCAGS